MFKIGDKVKVTKIVFNYESMGDVLWTNSMDSAVGKIFTISSVNIECHAVELKEFKHNDYLFPMECIVKVNHNYDKLLE